MKLVEKFDVNHIPLMLFVCSAIKALVLAPTVFEVVALGILGCVSFLYQYFGQSRRIDALETDFAARFKKFEAGVENLAVINNKLQSEVNGVKLRLGGNLTQVKGNVPHVGRRF